MSTALAVVPRQTDPVDVDVLLRSLPPSERAAYGIRQGADLLQRSGLLPPGTLPVSAECIARCAAVLALACLDRHISVQHAIALLESAPMPRTWR